MPQDPLDTLGASATAVQAKPDPLASLGTLATVVQTPPAQAGVVDRSIEGAKQFAAPIADLVKPPETPTEQLVHAIGGGGGALAAYRTAKNIVNSVETAVKSAPGEYKQAASNVVRAVQDFHNKDYRNALSDAVSAGTVLTPTIVPGGAATRELAEGARPGGNLATPLTRDALTAGTALVGGEAAVPAEEAEEGATVLRVNPFRAALEGKAVAQEPAAAAVRTAVGADPATALVKGNQTILDEPLSALQKQTKAAYQQVDKTAGFDLKDLTAQVSNDQYAIKQLGTTADDMVKRTNLQTSINNANTRIAEAQTKLAKAGIDPKSADVLNTSLEAGKDLKRIIVRNTAPDGTVNIDPLLKQSQALRFVKRGDRLAQFMGKDAADQYIQDLQAAQKAGVHAMKVQRIAKWVGGIMGSSVLGAAGYEGAKHLLSD